MTPWIDLDRCPCCRSVAEFRVIAEPEDANCGVEWIECAGCGLTTPMLWPGGADVKARLAARWNRREPAPACKVAAKVAAQVRDRAAVGLVKYGVTVADNPLSRRQWTQHALEEALDLAVYLQRLIDMEEAEAIEAESVQPRRRNG